MNIHNNCSTMLSLNAVIGIFLLNSGIDQVTNTIISGYWCVEFLYFGA